MPRAVDPKVMNIAPLL